MFFTDETKKMRVISHCIQKNIQTVSKTILCVLKLLALD